MHLNLFPLARDLVHYRKAYFLSDMFAGLSVALITFPQSVIYALMAGFPVECGIFGALLASVAAACFSGSHVLNMGPTNSTAVVLLSTFTAAGIFPERYGLFVPSVLILTGLFLILGAFLNIASLVRYVSKSVIFGYMCAVIIIMIVNQLHNALGFELHFPEGTKRTFLNTMRATLAGMQKTDGAPFFICVLCVISFYGWRKLFPRGPVIALTILTLAITTAWVTNTLHIPVKTLHVVRMNDWQPSLSGITYERMLAMAETALILSFVALIDGTTILQTLSARMGKRCNINQMVFGMGWANLFCGLGSGMPASCSLTRSTVNYVSGAKTAVAGLFCAFFCFLGILVLGSIFNFIPTSGLSMLIILLALGLFEKHSLKLILTDRTDACVFTLTFLSAFLFPLNTAIFLGVIISVALFLKKAAMPVFREYTRETFASSASTGENNSDEISVIRVQGLLFFGAAELFNDQIRNACRRPNLKVIIVKLRRIFYIDATCLLALEELLRYMQTNNRRLILTEVSPRALKIFNRSGLNKRIGEGFIFPDDAAHTSKPMQAALTCARQCIGKENITVRFLEPSTTVIDEASLKSSVSVNDKALSEHSVRAETK